MIAPLCIQQSGDEKQRRDGCGYSSYVVLEVTSEEEDEVMVEYSGKGHEEQEQDDPLAEYVARGAAAEGKGGAVRHRQMTPSSPPKGCRLHTRGSKSNSFTQQCSMYPLPS